MEFSLADRRDMIQAMGAEWEWKKGGTGAALCVYAQEVNERFEVQGSAGDIVTLTKRRLHVVKDDVPASVGDTFTRNDVVWKVGGISDDGSGFLELDVKKV